MVMIKTPESRWFHSTGRRMRHIRESNPHMICDVNNPYCYCGVWSPTIVRQFLNGRRPGFEAPWGTMISVTEEDYNEWPELIEGYPDGRDSLRYIIREDEDVAERDMARYD